MPRVSPAKRERLLKRKERYEAQLEQLHDLMDSMTSSDVQSYAIGSRNVSRYKSIAEVNTAIDVCERRIDDIEAQLEGRRRKAVAVVIRDV